MAGPKYIYFYIEKKSSFIIQKVMQSYLFKSQRRQHELIENKRFKYSLLYILEIHCTKTEGIEK